MASALDTLLAPTIHRADTAAAATDDDLFDVVDDATLAAELAELTADADAGPAVVEPESGAAEPAVRATSLEALAAVRTATEALGKATLPDAAEAAGTLPSDLAGAIAVAGGPVRVSAGAAAKVTSVARPSGELYHPRRLNGMTDVDVLRTCRKAGIHVLLDGMPGGGKTALVEAAFGEDLLTIDSNAEAEVTDFVGTWVQMPDGKYQWVYGPLATAMTEGKVLFVDDGTVISPGVWARQYPAMDGRGRITIREYMNEVVTAADGFLIVMAHNPDAPGAILAEPLASRFDLHLTVESDLHMAKDRLGVDPRLVKVAATLRAVRDAEPGAWAPETRELVQYMKVRDALGEDMALANFVSKAPVHAREQVIAALRPEFGSRKPLVLGA